MTNQPPLLSLSPEEIRFLTGNGALDDHNAPEEKNSPTKNAAPTTPTKIRVSNSFLYKRDKFFGAGTSKDDVLDILSQGDGNFSKPTTSPEKSSPGKKKSVSPIKITRNHPIRSFLKSTSPKSPSPKKSSFSSSQRSPEVSSSSPKKNFVLPAGTENNENSTADFENQPNSGYYFDALYTIVQTVRNSQQMAHLFTEQEKGILETFKRDQLELQLYVRLLNRVDTWRMASSIKYPEIAKDLTPLLSKLEKEGFIICDISKLPLMEILNLLKIESLKTLCKDFKLKCGKVKSDTIESLNKFHRTQPSFAAIHPVRKRAEEYLGTCFRLSQEVRSLFRRCALLFSMFHSNDELDKLTQVQGLLLLEVSRGRMVFPISAMDVSNDYHIFDNRDQFLRYEVACELRQEAYQFEKDTDKVEDLTKKALTEFRNLLQLKDEESASTLPPFLRRYRAGSVYARLLEKGAEKLRTGKNVDLAKNALLSLRDQDIYCQHRCGHWATTLSVLLQVNCKDNPAAAQEICRGLQLSKISKVDRILLNTRAHLTLKKKNTGLDPVLEKTLRSLLDPPLNNPTVVEIQGRSTNIQRPGMKRIWVAAEADGGRVYRSVEEEVIAHYRNLGFTSGRHDEGRFLRSLCLLSMWDIIYDINVPHVFLSQYQQKPLDWCTREFYATRSDNIEGRLEHLLVAGEEGLVAQLLASIEQHGNTSSLVVWEDFENVDCLSFLKCLKMPLFVALCRIMMRDFRAFRSGFPDLTLWDPTNEKCIFVEVKGPGDTLSASQMLWLHQLQESGAEAAVASVRATGSKASREARN